MPFIDARLSMKLSKEKEEVLKTRFGKAITLLNKPEEYLMIGFKDQYDLYFAGSKLEKGAYVAVSLYGEATAEAYEKMTAEVCGILKEELGIPGKGIYVTYHSVYNWGWNGTNF